MRCGFTTRAGMPLVIAGSLLAVSLVLVSPPVQVIYNASTSVPSGWYRVDAGSAIQVGDLVLVRLSGASAQLAGERGYLPAGVPLLKPVFATAPQRVCVVGKHLMVDGQAAAHARSRDRLDRLMPRWRECRALVGDELLLLAPDSADSFDSRYFGPVRTEAVLGKAKPLFVK